MAPIIVFGPLLASAFAGLFGNYVGHRAAQIVTTGAVLLSAVLSWIVFFDVTVGGNTTTIHLATWMSVRQFRRLLGDQAGQPVGRHAGRGELGFLAGTHLFLGLHVPRSAPRARFFSYLSLFTFAMLALVTAEQLPAALLRLGRRGAGLLSADRLLVQEEVGQ